MRPARDRYKVFIIDEVHQLSSHSFNALLKSIEEPPPHIIFMMATTELHKIPETILSRAQVFELRTIGTRAITEQLRRIADAEKVSISDEAITLVARAAEGSMRDAQSALDQVMSFGGAEIDATTVAEVLGLVEREALLDLLEIVANEDAARVFDIAGRLVESGHDLRHVCRELARLVRDLMVLQVDPARTHEDPEFAIEGDGDRLRTLATRFSREDLLRAFDLIAKLEQDIRVAAQPRFHLEMALLRWVHLRKLVPLTALLEGEGGSAPIALPRPAPSAGAPMSRPAPRPPSTPLTRTPAAPPSRAAAAPPLSAPPAPAPPARTLLVDDVSEAALGRYRDAFLAEIKRTRGQADWGMVFAPARKVEVAVGSVTFVFEGRAKVMASRFDALKADLSVLATGLAGRPMTVSARDETATAAAATATATTLQGEKDKLKASVMAEPAVQALLDVFPADIRDVEEVQE
jgi:DNA polymerase-3 subunit gamma/tau